MNNLHVTPSPDLTPVQQKGKLDTPTLGLFGGGERAIDCPQKLHLSFSESGASSQPTAMFRLCIKEATLQDFSRVLSQSYLGIEPGTFCRKSRCYSLYPKGTRITKEFAFLCGVQPPKNEPCGFTDSGTRARPEMMSTA